MSSGTGSIGNFLANLPHMLISSSQAWPSSVTEPQTPFRPARSLTKRLDQYINNFDMGFERVAKIRAKVLSGNGHMHSFDKTLAYPEQYKSRTVRALIHLSKHMEELAESLADISGLAERLTRNLISSGEKSDMALVIASGVGRVISGQLNFSGMAIHKVAGAGLYAVSSILSIAALGLIKAGWGARRTEPETEHARRKSNFESSTYLIVARRLIDIKESLLGKVLHNTDESGSRRPSIFHRWAIHLSRQKHSVPQHMCCRRKANCNYIWQNLHQYGRVTRSLMHVAYGIFQGINKLLVSYDKHLGAAIGNYLLKKKTGAILGCRLGMTVSVGSAAALSIPLSPFLIGVSTVGAMACGVALLALVLARLNVQLGHDWKGNIQRPGSNQVFGNVTPT
ncbi:hypothetical protein [Limnobacter alexandrii]|uniref:hypothetical protein n=1 Tax=Limnobacter alexandrii TaxID=2570352 RepID=UPI0011085434|nr:hypothetical protein [Limnobacter alexandrii]